MMDDVGRGREMRDRTAPPRRVDGPRWREAHLKYLDACDGGADGAPAGLCLLYA